MRWPSGDQDGYCVYTRQWSVSWVRFFPSASIDIDNIVVSASSVAESTANAMRWPSGDQNGAQA